LKADFPQFARGEEHRAQHRLLIGPPQRYGVEGGAAQALEGRQPRHCEVVVEGVPGAVLKVHPARLGQHQGELEPTRLEAVPARLRRKQRVAGKHRMIFPVIRGGARAQAGPVKPRVCPGGRQVRKPGKRSVQTRQLGPMHQVRRDLEPGHDVTGVGLAQAGPPGRVESLEAQPRGLGAQADERAQQESPVAQYDAPHGRKLAGGGGRATPRRPQPSDRGTAQSENLAPVRTSP